MSLRFGEKPGEWGQGQAIMGDCLMVSAHRFGLILGEQREVGGVLGVLAQASFQSVLFN